MDSKPEQEITRRPPIAEQIRKGIVWGGVIGLILGILPFTLLAMVIYGLTEPFFGGQLAILQIVMSGGLVLVVAAAAGGILGTMVALIRMLFFAIQDRGVR